MYTIIKQRMALDMPCLNALAGNPMVGCCVSLTETNCQREYEFNFDPCLLRMLRKTHANQGKTNQKIFIKIVDGLSQIGNFLGEVTGFYSTFPKNPVTSQ